MRVRVLVPIVMTLVAACQDSVGPTPADQRLGATTSDPVQVLFQAARAQAPIDVSRGITISIPAAHLSERSAEVLFYNDLVFERYRFEKEGDTWSRGARVARGPFQPLGGSNPATGVANAGYSSVIATLYDLLGNPRDNDWLISNKTETGYFFREEEYTSNLPFSGTFNPGTEEVGDTTFQVSFQGPWEAWRQSAPTGSTSLTCGNATCDLKFAWDSAGHTAYVGAEKAKVTGYLRVTRPVTNVQISGTDSISGVAGNQQWSASAQGGDGQSMSYTWEDSDNGTSGWTQVGTGTTYTRYIGSGDSNTTFYLRVTATSNGKSGQSDVKQVDIHGIADPLNVSVSGTNAILSSGWYAWSLSASGGTTPYSYLWEYCDGSCTSVGTGTSYSRYVQLGDGDFTVKLTVTDSGSGSLQQQEIVWHGVYVAPDGGGTLLFQPDSIR